MATLLPPCTTPGIIDLCEPSKLITAGSHIDQGAAWFSIQQPNLIWFLLVLALFVIGIFLPFPTKEVKLEESSNKTEGGSNE